MPPRDYIFYIVVPEDISIADALKHTMQDELVTGVLPELVSADFKYSNRPKHIYRLTHTPRERRGREDMPIGQRGKWRKKAKPKTEETE